jgi:hypothetical protein
MRSGVLTAHPTDMAVKTKEIALLLRGVDIAGSVRVL